MEKSSTYAGTAAKQLGLYAVYLLVAVSFLIYILAFFAGTTGVSVNGGAINEERNSITIAVSQEPPQLDSTRSTDASSFVVLAHTMEGLISYDDNDQLTPGVAERWDIREDGATFWIRDEARWSDGRAVTAHDFEFSWKRVLDPSTASEYAFILYSIKNAEAVNQGNLPKEALGVRAISDLVLEVDFERPTPYFDKLVAFNTYYPVREDFFESTNGRYGADADMLLFNGPYVLAEWIHGASMLWKKNPHYWNDEKGFLDEIVTAYITNDANASLNLFKDGQIVQTSLTAPMLETAMEQRWQIDRFMDGSLFFLEFNHREGRVTENLNFRKALLLAQDPSELVYKVLKEASYLPAESLFPVWIQGL